MFAVQTAAAKPNYLWAAIAAAAAVYMVAKGRKQTKEIGYAVGILAGYLGYSEYQKGQPATIPTTQNQTPYAGESDQSPPYLVHTGSGGISGGGVSDGGGLPSVVADPYGNILSGDAFATQLGFSSIFGGGGGGGSSINPGTQYAWDAAIPLMFTA